MYSSRGEESYHQMYVYFKHQSGESGWHCQVHYSAG